MSRHWKPTGSTRWLSADAYAALSPAEKRQLWRDRRVTRHEARFRPAPARFRKGYFARQRLYWFLGVAVGVPLIVAVLQFMPETGSAPAGAAEPAGPIEWNAVQELPRAQADPADAEWAARANNQGSPSTGSGRAARVTTAVLSTGSRQAFGYCYSGGGTNCVVDGDTFWIGGEKVRIADIDAPETHPPRCAYEARLGNQATEKLHTLLNSGAVTMTSIDRDRDVYGRLLRNVSVNGADVGEAMVSAGVAREWVGRREPWC